MNVTRRHLLAAGATGTTAALAGCAGILDETLTSRPATVPEAVRSETGYDERTVEELIVERTVGRFGIDRSIEVTNWYAEYDRAVPLDGLGLGLGRAQAAVASVLTTPQISFLGRTFNPVGELSTAELIELIQDRYEELEDVDHRDATTVSVLGTETTVDRYLAQARLIDAGTTLEVYLQITEPIAHGDDFVICVAVYPQLLGMELESASVRTLFEGVNHEN
ncbi:hypothetical protein C482_04406 [Natrialba chahannaoensis JCM 10990]|uniref:Lipoprotein n=1 Tax=Natrialba chahannaoensis JCM 10990 TaxID=1227492 RepID=M0AZL0_9EURY|nr:DUF6517 family protein [Natrialba chahannaoensis]ELZ02874.1 hypothetical protein C482_04406 [Natrialba chahannaoensis JCM 10990]